jgi:hypothetical protein
MASSTRTYQPVPCALWNDEDFLALSETAQKIFFYLLTNIHSNLLGLYVLKEGYALSDLRIGEPRKYRNGLTEIQTAGLIDFDATGGIVLIKRHYLSASPILSPNQIKAIKYLVGDLPRTNLIYALKEVLRSPEVISRGKNVEVLEELERLYPGEVFRQETGKGTSPTEPHPPSSDPPKAETDKERLKENASALVKLWNEICGDILAKVSEITKNRMTHIKTRLRERSLEEWAKIFRKISISSFLTGHGKEGWAASFDWIMSTYDNSVKVLEGKYDDRNGGSGPRGMDALRNFGQKIEERQSESESGEISHPSEEGYPPFPEEDVAP